MKILRVFAPVFLFLAFAGQGMAHSITVSTSSGGPLDFPGYLKVSGTITLDPNWSVEFLRMQIWISDCEVLPEENPGLTDKGGGVFEYEIELYLTPGQTYNLFVEPSIFNVCIGGDFIRSTSTTGTAKSE